MSRETDELAELLRALKERSGRSYGALGKRLHVSTSTLHRYCNGTAVPSEYAPLERFARVCGARAEELVDLHRRWILADASRRRDRSADGGSTASEGSTTSAESAVAARATDQEAGPVGSAESEESTADATGTSGGVRTGEALALGHESAVGQEAAPGPQPDLPRDAAPGRETARTSRFRRPRLLIAAVAVTVAAVAVPTAVIAAGDPTSPSRHPAANVTGDGSDAPAPQGTGTAATRAGTEAPTRSASSSATASAGRAAAGSPSPFRSETSSASPPFHVNVLTNNWDSPCDQWFLLNRAPGTVTPPPASQATDGWAAALGAVPAGHLRLQVTVQGSSSQPVVLHALYVRMAGTRKAPAGNAYTMGSGCGGDLAPASFAVDLDAQAPSARPVPGHEGNIKARATDFPYKVSADDPEVLNIDASTVAQDVDWYLDLSWSSGDRQGTARIDDHGRPFRTAGMRGDKQYWYDAGGAHAWVPYGS
ncbi:helix-turn-helix domain-containing protein [Streptomyces sp. NPDC001848]|uniref:helix-turn-helix domain-containing protein n=1 Tax=Streptomyces sp. NPDC001848 TaxID=3364618 RepID=UPI0036C8806F